MRLAAVLAMLGYFSVKWPRCGSGPTLLLLLIRLLFLHRTLDVLQLPVFAVFRVGFSFPDVSIQSARACAVGSAVVELV